jgi:hypothetical protein
MNGPLFIIAFLFLGSILTHFGAFLKHFEAFLKHFEAFLKRFFGFWGVAFLWLLGVFFVAHSLG